jgi:hypothetical protein
MTEERDIEEDLKPSVGDYVHAGMRAGISVTPVIGGPVVELFNMLIAPPLEKRRDEWLIELYKRLKKAEQEIDGFKIENLQSNDQFISILFSATQIAMRTHQKEKLEALRNAVINSSISPQIEENQHWVFLNMLDRYTPWHIIILKFYDTPRHTDDKNFPEPFNTHKDFAQKIVKELNNDGLVYTTVTKVDNNMILPNITNLGKQFLKFFDDPLNHEENVS